MATAKAVEIIFATVLRIVDGDTLIVKLPCDLDFVCNLVEVRVLGIDTPELHGFHCPKELELAKKAKAMLEGVYPIGSTFALANPHKDKYGRLLGNAPVAEKKLLEAGLAKPYKGGNKAAEGINWCSEK